MVDGSRYKICHLDRVDFLVGGWLVVVEWGVFLRRGGDEVLGSRLPL